MADQNAGQTGNLLGLGYQNSSAFRRKQL